MLRKEGSEIQLYLDVSEKGTQISSFILGKVTLNQVWHVSKSFFSSRDSQNVTSFEWISAINYVYAE